MFESYEPYTLDIDAETSAALNLGGDTGSQSRIVLCKSRRGNGWPFLLVTSTHFTDENLKEWAGAIAGMIHPDEPSGPVVCTTEGEVVGGES